MIACLPRKCLGLLGILLICIAVESLSFRSLLQGRSQSHLLRPVTLQKQRPQCTKIYSSNTDTSPSVPKLTTSELIDRIFRPNTVESSSNLQWLRNNAQTVLAEGKKLVLPAPKAEAWRYNNLFKLFRNPYRKIVKDTAYESFCHEIKDKVAPFVNERCSNSFYVFIDGIYNPSLSHPLTNSNNEAAFPQFVSISSMTSDIQNRFINELGFYPDANEPPKHSFGSDILTSLNIENTEDIGLMYIPPSYNATDRPVQFIHISSGKVASMAHPKLLVYVDEGASFDFKQSFITLNASTSSEDASESFDDEAYLVNGNTRIVVSPKAVVRHTMTQELSDSGRHLEVLSAEVKEGSNYKLSLIQSGAAVGRVNVHFNISGSFANATIKGVSLSGAQQSLDLHSSIIHNAESSRSNQQHRNIIADQGEAIFKGRIRIPKHAQMTSSEQLCRTLMMGERARVVAMPTLEITADNVECSHGASVSDLDENAMFYLASRGLNRQESRQLLLRGFVLDMLDGALMDNVETLRVLSKVTKVSDSKAGLTQQYLSL